MHIPGDLCTYVFSKYCFPNRSHFIQKKGKRFAINVAPTIACQIGIHTHRNLMIQIKFKFKFNFLHLAFVQQISPPFPLCTSRTVHYYLWIAYAFNGSLHYKLEPRVAAQLIQTNASYVICDNSSSTTLHSENRESGTDLARGWWDKIVQGE